METNHPKEIPKTDTGFISEEILQKLADPAVKDEIREQIEKMKKRNSGLMHLNYLAIAPNFLLSHADVLVILCFLQEACFIPKLLLCNMIQRITGCQEDEITIYSTAELSEQVQNGFLSQEDYQRLVRSSIPLDGFNAKTYDELEAKFHERNKLRNEIPLLSPKKVLQSESNKNLTKLKIRFLRNGAIKGLTQEEAGKLNAAFGKDFSYYEANKKIEHLKKLAIKHGQKKEVSEENCEDIIRKLENLYSHQIEKGITTLLHLVIELANFPNRLISITESMATLKFLLGVDPNTTPNEVIKKSPSCKFLNADQQNILGQTPLHIAAKASGGILYWLLALEADPTIKDNQGRLPIDDVPYRWTTISKSMKDYMKELER